VAVEREQSPNNQKSKMGKPKGFIEYLRELPLDRPALERIRDWNEFHLHLDDKKLGEQGARCMDCGVPFCHTGKLISGMASGCPSIISSPSGMTWSIAASGAKRSNASTRPIISPNSTGRVCPAPCEGSCVLGINDPPVTIKNIECSIIDKGWDEGWVTAEAPSTRTGKKVAVIGSGPPASAPRLN